MDTMFGIFLLIGFFIGRKYEQSKKDREIQNCDQEDKPLYVSEHRRLNSVYEAYYQITHLSKEEASKLMDEWRRMK